AIINLVTHAQRSTTITRRRLNEQTLERCIEQDLAVHYRVVRHTARQAQVSQAGLLVKMIQHVKPDFFETKLQARRNVALAISQRSAGRAGWAKEVFIFVGKDPADHG